MTIVAKFRGICRECGGAIKRGQPIDWTRGQGAAHESCISQPEGFRPGYDTEAMLEDEYRMELFAGDAFMAGLRSGCGR